MTGRELRTRIQQLIDERMGKGGDLAERVRYELSHSPAHVAPARSPTSR